MRVPNSLDNMFNGEDRSLVEKLIKLTLDQTKARGLPLTVMS
jgi:hypothetical protein